MGTLGLAHRRALIAAAACILVVAVAAVAVVLARGGPRPLPAGTPEGTVQRYTEAALAGDTGEAVSYLSERTRRGCGAGTMTPGAGDDLRVTLDGATVDGDRARVDVVVAFAGFQGPFGGDGFEAPGRFALSRDGARWLIDSVPPELQVCPEAPAGEVLR